MTAAEVSRLVAVVIAAFPGARVNSGTSQIYERMLADLPYPAANAAVERLLATTKFLPSVAEIREAALTVANGEQTAGGEAWGEVQRLIARWGSRRYDENWSPPITDPVAKNVVRALGWVALCDSENPTADRARFIELYDRLASTHRRLLLSDHLPAMQRYRALQGAENTVERLAEPSNEVRRGDAVALGALLPFLPTEQPGGQP